MKLSQLLAIHPGIKARAYEAATKLYQSKRELFDGFVKTYRPKDEAGERYPDESKKVQLRANDVIKEFSSFFTDYMDIQAKLNYGNAAAKGTIEVGSLSIKDVPTEELLHLEKALADIRTFYDSLPVLDEAEQWTGDAGSGLMKTATTETQRTKKVQKALVLLQPTTEHPGQAVPIVEDEVVGYWNQTKMSGAVTRDFRQTALDRIGQLQAAVKVAREQANGGTEIPVVPSIGKQIFDYISG